MVVVDSTILLLMLMAETPVGSAKNGSTINSPHERIKALVDSLDKTRTKIIIPSPVLSEILVRAGSVDKSQEIVERLHKYSVFRIEPFDERAAIEVAAMDRDSSKDQWRKDNPDAIWAKLKYDRQIVAIAKVIGSTTIYSDDKDIRKLAQGTDIQVMGIYDLPLPNGSRQIPLLNVPDSINSNEEDLVAGDE